jgi:hypothetical protein
MLFDRMAQNICFAGDDFDYWIPLGFDDEGNVRQFEVRLLSLLQHHLRLVIFKCHELHSRLSTNSNWTFLTRSLCGYFIKRSRNSKFNTRLQKS